MGHSDVVNIKNGLAMDDSNVVVAATVLGVCYSIRTGEGIDLFFPLRTG